MKIVLSGGQTAAVGVHHTGKFPSGRRGTVAWVRVEGRPPAEGMALCSSEDNFCKRTGRHLAAARLLAALRRSPELYTKEDRRAVFDAVCPEHRNAARR